MCLGGRECAWGVGEGWGVSFGMCAWEVGMCVCEVCQECVSGKMFLSKCVLGGGREDGHGARVGVRLCLPSCSLPKGILHG